MKNSMLLLAVTLFGGLCLAAERSVQTGDVPQPSSGTDRLVAGLDSPNAKDRATATWQLARGKPGDPALLQRLAGLRDSDTDEGVRLAATYACGRLATEESSCPGSDYDRPPRPKKMVRPKYPATAFANGVMGTVLVDFLISERGVVVHAEVRQSIPELDAAALEAVRGWTYEPAVRNGRAVACFVEAPVGFRKE
jgi:protein TonB